MSIRTRIAVTSLVLVSSSFAVPALAQETVGAHVTPGSPTSMFGSRGQIAISSEAGATYTHTSVSGVSGATTSLVLRPGVDYFVIDRLSIGAFVGIDRKTTPAESTTTWGIGPRVGYDIAFSDHFSIWPRIGFSYNSISLKVDEPVSVSNSNHAIALNLFAPFLFHTNHYFAGVGPALDTDLSGDAKMTTWGIQVTLGGWIF
jgi:hypothetical protein